MLQKQQSKKAVTETKLSDQFEATPDLSDSSVFCLNMVDEYGQPADRHNMPSVIYPKGIITKDQIQMDINEIENIDCRKIMQLYAKSKGFMRLALKEMLLRD